MNYRKHNHIILLLLVTSACSTSPDVSSGMNPNESTTQSGDSVRPNSGSSGTTSNEPDIGLVEQAVCPEELTCIGEVGPAGPMGSPGADGATGAAGPIGPTGPTGPRGSTGLQGAIGPRGAVGATGPQGATGATGATGSRGQDGSFDLGALYTVHEPVTANIGDLSLTARCEDGDVVLTGGCAAASAPQYSILKTSYPYNSQAGVLATPDSWVCDWYVRTSGYYHAAVVHCLDVTP